MIELLRRSWVALLVLVLALIAQIPHAAFVSNAAPYLGQVGYKVQEPGLLSLAYAFAIGFEMLTLMFVVHGHRVASYGFSAASFAINLCYYSMHGVALWSMVALPAWLLSVLLPCAIASYSHILAGAQDTPLQVGAWVHGWWAKVRGNNAQPIVHDVVLATMPVEPPVIVHSEVVTVHDGAPDPSDRPAYARWLHMEKGVTQSTLATQFGVHRNTIGKWLRSGEEVVS